MSDLAVVIMAYNEAECLARAIDSVSAWAPVHVSVDTADQDGCAQLAAQMGARVYHHEGLPPDGGTEPGTTALTARNSYARMRNDVLEQVRVNEPARWFLWLDADEIVTGGAEELLGYLPRLQDDVAGIAVTMKLYSREGALESLMRNSKLIRRDVTFTRRRHEHIVYPTTDQQARCDALVIEHRPTQPLQTREQHDTRKLNRQAFIDDWHEFGDGRSAFYCADWYTINGDAEAALRWYDKALTLPDALCPGFQRAQAAVYAGKLYLREMQPDRAVECFHVAMRHEWQYAEACYYLGFVAANRRSWDEARYWFRCSMLHPENPQTVMQQEMGCSSYMAVVGLAAVEAHDGNRAEAYRLLNLAERMENFPYKGLAAATDLRQKLDAM